jgi:hypothetical protein
MIYANISKNFLGEFHLLYKIYCTKELSTKLSRRLFGVDSRLKNAEIGYTLPRKVTENFYVSNLRVYMSGVNLLTFSRFKLWDPERGGGEGAAYPPNRMFTLGINVYF